MSVMFDYRAQLEAPRAPNYSNYPGVNGMVNVPDGAVFVPTNSAAAIIRPNDLVALQETGVAIAVDATIGAATAVNNTAGPSTLLGPYAATSGEYQSVAHTQNASSLTVLRDGRVAMVYSGDGTTSTLNVRLAILSALGGMPGTTALVSTDGTNSAVVYQLSNDNILVLWGNGVNTRFAVYSTALAVIVAPTTITNAATDWGSCLLANGNFVVAYRKVSTNNTAFSIFSPAGVLQGSEVAVESSNAPAFFALTPCANTDFVMMYHSPAVGYRISRWSVTGTVVVALITLTTGGSIMSLNYREKSVIELSDGRLVFAASHPTSADAFPDLYIRSSALAAVVTIDLGTTFASSNWMPILLALPNGDFAYLGINASRGSPAFAIYSSSGAIIAPLQVLTAFTRALIQSDCTMFAVYQPNLGFCFGAFANQNNTNWCIEIRSISFTGATRGSSLVFNNGTTAIKAGQFAANDTGTIYTAYSLGNIEVLYLAAVKTVRSSILGVALTAGSQYRAAMVSTKGSYSINQNIAGNGVFDCRAFTVPGTRGIYAGNTAYLAGLI